MKTNKSNLSETIRWEFLRHATELSGRPAMAELEARLRTAAEYCLRRMLRK